MTLIMDLSTDEIRMLMSTYCHDLSVEQKKPVRAVLRGNNIFLTGGAGTGKTYVLKALNQALQGAFLNVVVCAPTGIAALNIGGVTIHNVFNLNANICINDNNKLIIHAPKVIQAADVIIIDEISMVRMDLFDAVVAGIRKAEKKKNKKIQVVVCGDFCQLPPVINNNAGDRKLLEQYYNRDIGLGFAFQGNEWNKCNFKIYTLTKSFRQKDSEFLENLNKLRIGDSTAIPYFNAFSSQRPFWDAPYLSFTNSKAKQINQDNLNQLAGESISLQATYTGDANINSVDIPNEIRVKIGARVILSINDNYNHPDARSVEYEYRIIKYEYREPFYLNGTWATVVDYYGDDALCLDIDNGQRILLSRHAYPVYTYLINPSGQIQRKLIGKVQQYPIQLGYATTIHKSQGQTYSAVNVDPSTYGRSVSGLIYVALSRVKSIDGLHLMRYLHPTDLFLHPDVLDFYAGKFARKQGRPRKYSDSKVVSVPVELEKHVKKEIEKNTPLPMHHVSHKKTGKRVSIRVPDNLLPHVKDEIIKWRKELKKR